MSSTPFVANMMLDAYPERQESHSGWLEHTLAGLVSAAKQRLHFDPINMPHFYNRIQRYTAYWTSVSTQQRMNKIAELRYQLVSQGLEDELVASAFALIQHTAHRVLGITHYNVQLMTGWIMLNGMIAEMETGEGKTLSATLPAATAAMARIPVHIITANDYLAQRDAHAMGPLYHALGLSVGVVTAGATLDERREAYHCDITYGSNKQMALDYLRDRIRRGNKTGTIREKLKHNNKQQHTVMRGLCYAIIDEADSVLIDDARIPLILAKEQTDSSQYPVYVQSMAFAHLLEVNTDFVIQAKENKIELTEQGQQHIAELVSTQTEDSSAQAPFESLILLALRALHLLEKNKHYVIKDNQVQLIDENTGRSQADRSWQHGLQQMIECKEECIVSKEQEVLARLTYQRFFRRYLHLAGMTGTATEVKDELRRIYHLEVAQVPPRLPGKRVELPDQVHQNASFKWLAAVRRIKAIHKTGRPILIGTRTVKDSEYLSTLLQREQLNHQVLNAKHDRTEAEIIARAGQHGQITIATNMAGRGTDIKLDKATAALGGLHVISLERNDARRIDRQLFGRCAREGQIGSCEAILSLEDELIKQHIPTSFITWLQKRYHDRPLPQRLGRLLMRRAQKAMEQQHSQVRRTLLQWDKQQDQTMAFSAWKE